MTSAKDNLRRTPEAISRCFGPPQKEDLWPQIQGFIFLKAEEDQGPEGDVQSQGRAALPQVQGLGFRGPSLGVACFLSESLTGFRLGFLLRDFV